MKTSEIFDFEQALTNLDNIVNDLEKGNDSLETALQKFEQGVKLTRQCQHALTQAQQRVAILLKDSPDSELADFHLPEDESEGEKSE